MHISYIALGDASILRCAPLAWSPYKNNMKLCKV